MSRAKLEAEIGIKTSKFKRGMRIIRQQTKRSIKTFGKLLKVGAVAAVGVSVALFKMAKGAQEFNKQVGQVSTLTNIPLKTLKKRVKELSAEFGLAKDTLTKGLYDALSAGIPEDNVFEFMKVASKAAIGGAASTEETVDLLTTAINAFKLEASDAGRVSDILFTVVKLGKTTMSELASSLADVAPLARTSGISLEEVGGAIATLTKNGTKTPQAITQIRGAIIAMNRELGDGWAKTMTLVEGMQKMRDMSGGSENELKKLTGRIEGMLGILGLTGEKLQESTDDFNAMGIAAGNAAEAFGKMDELSELDKSLQAIDNIVNNIGDSVLTGLLPALKKLNKELSRPETQAGISEYFNNLTEGLKDIYNSRLGQLPVHALKGVAAGTAMIAVKIDQLRSKRYKDEKPPINLLSKKTDKQEAQAKRDEVATAGLLAMGVDIIDEPTKKATERLDKAIENYKKLKHNVDSFNKDAYVDKWVKINEGKKAEAEAVKSARIEADKLAKEFSKATKAYSAHIQQLIDDQNKLFDSRDGTIIRTRPEGELQKDIDELLGIKPKQNINGFAARDRPGRGSDVNLSELGKRFAANIGRPVPIAKQQLAVEKDILIVAKDIRDMQRNQSNNPQGVFVA